MPQICLLDASVVNLIAAGEVVDRPASAVKEMVENAIDAGAKHISVEIRRGGLEMIRITDDGCGMSAENARISFLKHATSKISSQEDLTRISTLGFRGEALAAISAVSNITLVTKESGQTTGARFEVSEGKIISEEECGCPDGSSFTVKNLFFNTPARLKFMKSEPAETGAVQAIIERLALSHPQISFRLYANGTERLHTAGSGNLMETVFSVFGKEFTEMSIPTDVSSEDIRVHGLVGKPIYSKANRNRQIFFLNGRYVRSPIFTSGFESAYHNKMLIGRTPVCVLFIDIPTSQVDVNVHPSKLEVKFTNENAVSYAVRKAAEEALSADSGIVEIKISGNYQNPYGTTAPPKTVLKRPLPSSEQSIGPIKNKTPQKIQDSQPSFKEDGIKDTKIKDLDPFSKKLGWTITPPVADLPKSSVVLRDVVAENHQLRSKPTAITKKSPENHNIISSETKKEERCTKETISAPVTIKKAEEPVLFHAEQSFRVVGEIYDCYILVERGEDLLFVDKHALHERINFEKFRKSDIPSQSLLTPIVFHLGIDENRILSENADFLSRFGFILESFGDDLLIREIPALISPEQADPLLQQFAESLSLGKDETLMDRFYYDIACKASIRSGSKTSLSELEELVSEYFRREKELQYCPHGRPIVFSLSKKSVEKQFKRLK